MRGDGSCARGEQQGLEFQEGRESDVIRFMEQPRNPCEVGGELGVRWGWWMEFVQGNCGFTKV